ncbi:MAG: RNA-binding protein [Kiritimatiellia bacterium]
MSLFTFIGKLFGGTPASKGPQELIEIYVGNISYDMTGEQLRKAFAKFGTVKSARVIDNRFNHKSKGFGFVEMIYRPEAEAAIKALHDKNIMGRRLRVNEAKNKTRE